jgi:hypothetical protein
MSNLVTAFTEQRQAPVEGGRIQDLQISNISSCGWGGRPEKPFAAGGERPRMLDEHSPY